MSQIWILVIFLFSLTLSACAPKSTQLFAEGCAQSNANCQEPVLSFSSAGARADVTVPGVVPGATVPGLLIRPIRHDETISVEFTIRNTRLVPLRNFTLGMSPGGLTVETSSSEDCSRRSLLVYDRTCTVVVSFTPGVIPPPQILAFKFKTLLGDPVEFSTTLDGAKILSEFYISDSLALPTDVVHNSSDAGYYEREITVYNHGSEDSIAGLSIGISGSDASEYSIVPGGAGYCTEGGTLSAGGGSCKIKIRYKPLTAKRKSASLVLSGQGGFARSYALEAEAIALTTSTNQVNFGTRMISSAAIDRQVQITHPGAITASSAETCTYNVSGSAAYTIASNSCGPNVTAGSTCEITVRMTPAASSEWHQGSLLVTCDSRGGEISVPLSGQSVSTPLLADISVLDFGSQLVGSTQTRSIALTNQGTLGNLTSFVRSLVSITGAGLSLTSETCSTSLTAGSQCSVTVSYSPQSVAPTTSSFAASSAQASLENGLLIKGAGIVIQSSEVEVDFGSVVVDKDRVGQTVLISNPSASQTATGCSLDQSALAAQGFSLDAVSTCLTTSSISPGSSCTIRPRFTASSSLGERVAKFRFACAIGGATEVQTKAQVVNELRLVVNSPTSISLLDRLVGSSTERTITLSNAHATAPAPNLSVSTPSLSAPWSRVALGLSDCSNFTQLVAGESCSIRMRYAPLATYGAEQTGTTTGIIAVSADSGAIDPVDPIYSGQAKKIEASRSSYAFGIIPTGVDADSPTIVIQNPSSIDSASSCSISVSAPFTLQAQTCGSTLPPLGNCSLKVRVPSQATSVDLSGTVRMDCSVGGRAAIALTASAKLPPTLQWSGTSAFGNVDVGQSQTNALTLTHTGLPLDAPTSALTIGFATPSSSSYSIVGHNCPAALSPAQSCVVNVRYTAAAAASTSATLRASNPGTAVDLALTGTGIDPSLHAVLSPATIGFTNRLLGATVNQDVTISNDAASGTTTGLSIGAPSTGAPWSIDSGASTCGSSLAYSSSCVVRLVYQPTVTGTTTGTVAVSATNLPTAKSIAYSASAVRVTPSGSSLDFGVVDLFASKTHATTITVMNPSSLDTATSCSLSFSNAAFSAASSTCNGGNLATGGSCTYQVTLAPQSTEATVTGNATVSCSIGGTATVSLTAVIKDIPSLSFDASPSPAFANWDIDAAPLTKIFTIRNSETYAVSLTGLGLKLAASSFAIVPSGTMCTASTVLQPAGSANDTCTISVAFDPSTETSGSGGETGVIYASVAVPQAHDFELPISGTGTTMNLTSSDTSLTFAKREISEGTETLTATINNTGGRTANLTYSSLSAPFSRGGTCGATLAGGQSCTVAVTIVGHSSAGSHSATLSVSDVLNGNTKSVSIALAGETVAAPSLKIKDDRANPTYTTTITTTDITGAVDTANNIFDLSPAYREATIHIKNDIAAGAGLNLSSPSLTYKSGTDTTMSIQSSDCSTTLAAAASCSFKVRYTPTTSDETSTFTVSVEGTSAVSGATHTVSVTNIIGTSRRAVSLSISSSYDFSPILQSTTSDSPTITVTNDGHQTATGLTFGFSGTNASTFSRDNTVTSNCGTTLSGGATCNVRLKFSPTGVTGAFQASFASSGDHAGATRTLALKAASFREDAIGSDSHGLEGDLISDSNRFYLISRRDAGSSKFEPVLTVCTRTAAGLLDTANCTVTDVGSLMPTGASGNFAGDMAGSGPRIAQYGKKLIIAIQNKDTGRLGGSVGGTSTLVLCQKPTTGNTVTQCAYTRVNVEDKSGQLPSLIVTNNKVVLSNTGPDSKLIITVCSYDSTSDTTDGNTLNSTSCRSLEPLVANQGWYTSTAFNGTQVVVATFDKTGTIGLRLTTCSVASDNVISGCVSSIVDGTSEIDGLDTLYTGAYPSLVMDGTRLYVAHQLGETKKMRLRLTACDLSGTNVVSGCLSQTVAGGTGIAVGNTPRVTLSGSGSTGNLWISAVTISDPSSNATSARLQFYRCALPISAASCAATSAYSGQASDKGYGPIFSRSLYLDAANKLLIAPFTMDTNDPYIPQKNGLFQLGLTPEL